MLANVHLSMHKNQQCICCDFHWPQNCFGIFVYFAVYR